MILEQMKNGYLYSWFVNCKVLNAVIYTNPFHGVKLHNSSSEFDTHIWKMMVLADTMQTIFLLLVTSISLWSFHTNRFEIHENVEKVCAQVRI